MGSGGHEVTEAWGGVGWTSTWTPGHCPLKRLPRASILSEPRSRGVSWRCAQAVKLTRTKDTEESKDKPAIRNGKYLTTSKKHTNQRLRRDTTKSMYERPTVTTKYLIEMNTASSVANPRDTQQSG
eukprot:2581307-Amphidinium_carterae.4